MGGYRLDGRNPLSYMGVKPSQPPQLLVRNAAPTANDVQNLVIGTLWVVQQKSNPSQDPAVYMLVNQEQNQATWIELFPGSGTGAIESLTGNSGGAVLPTAADPANINILGTGTITVVGNPGTNTLTVTPSGAIASSFITSPATGTAIPASGVLTFSGAGGNTVSASGSTVTITGPGPVVASVSAGNNISITGTATNPIVNVAGTTQYNVQVGAATGALTSIAPSATTGVPLVSQGAAANPAFGTAAVAGGGTGNTTFTAYSVITGGTTATGPFQNVSGLGTAGQVLTSNGAGALPTWQDIIANSGTWTPTLSFSGGTSGVVYNTQVGVYESFDNLVYYECGIVITSIGASAGNCTITGLPFTCSVSHPINTVVMIMDGLTLAGGYTYSVAGVIPGASTIQLLQQGSGLAQIPLTAANWTTAPAGGYAAISIAAIYFKS